MSDGIRNGLVRSLTISLEQLRLMNDADGVKVYFQDSSHYVVKFIKANKVIDIIRCKRNSFDNNR